MASIDEIREQVKANLTVRHIMIPREGLVFYGDDGYMDYDIVPIRGNNYITHYYDKEANKENKIEAMHIISSCVDLVTLLRCLRDQSFFFVKDSDEIIGFVNISDMNTKSPLRLLLFTLICNIEMKLKEICSSRLCDECLKEMIEEKWEEIQNEIREDKKKHIDVSPYEYFNFSYYINLIKKSESLREFIFAGSKEIPSASKFGREYGFLCEFRNHVAHSSKKSLTKKPLSETDYAAKLYDRTNKTIEFLDILVEASNRLDENGGK